MTCILTSSRYDHIAWFNDVETDENKTNWPKEVATVRTC